MSVADGGVDPFDLIWDMIKSPLYHSVNTDLSDPAVAEKLGQLRDELMAEGITFDTGWGAEGRDWELDFSLKNATPDEVISRMRDAGIPFNTQMWYEDDEVAEARIRESEEIRNRHDPNHPSHPNYKPAEGIGNAECYECGEMAMVIRESDDRISLACPHCSLSDHDWGENEGRGWSDGVVKFDAWDIAKMKFKPFPPEAEADMDEQDRMANQRHRAAYGVDVDLNLNIGGNQGDCCESFRQRMQEIWAGTPYDDAPDFTDVGTSGWFWDETINTEDCEVIIQRWNDSIKPIVEGDMKGAGESEIKGVSYSDGSVRDLPPHYHIIKDMIEDTLQAIEEYNSCDRGGFEGVDFGGDFQASGDVFEDSWNIAKFDAERAGTARMVEQEQMPFEDEEVNVDLNPNGGEPDKCCLGALQLYQELTGDYTKSNPWIWSKGVTTHDPPTDGFGEGELDCDELHSWLEWLVYDDPEAELMGDEDLAPKAKKVLEQWESCISEDFSGDFTASGDSFEDAWSVAKNLNPSAGFGRERCWLCEKVKDSFGRYPNLPYYPPNWKRPCDCSGEM